MNLVNAFLRLNFSIYIKKITIWPIITFISNVKIILQKLEQKDLTKFCLPPFFYTIILTFIDNSISIN